MKRRHPTDGELDSFVEGRVDSREAIRIANHLDACAVCRQRALARDPLHLDLLDSQAPVDVPPGLVDQILATAPTRAQPWGRAPVLVMAALAASGLVAMMLGHPTDPFSTESAWRADVSLSAVASTCGPLEAGCTAITSLAAGAMLFWARRRKGSTG